MPQGGLTSIASTDGRRYRLGTQTVSRIGFGAMQLPGPLGSAFARANPVLGNPAVMATAARLGYTPAQVALAWLLRLRPNVLLIPGTSSLRHLEENMAVANVVLDAEARQLLTSGA